MIQEQKLKALHGNDLPISSNINNSLISNNSQSHKARTLSSKRHSTLKVRESITLKVCPPIDFLCKQKIATECYEKK